MAEINQKKKLINNKAPIPLFDSRLKKKQSHELTVGIGFDFELDLNLLFYKTKRKFICGVGVLGMIVKLVISFQECERTFNH